MDLGDSRRVVYEKLNDYDKALEVMKKAEELIIAGKLSADRSVNTAIARYYARVGDTGRAKDYYNKEIQRIQTGENAADNASVIKHLEQLRAELR